MTLRDQIIGEEGNRLMPYRDHYGFLTIGYGRNLDANGISEDEAALMLDNDLARFTTAVDSRYPWATALDEVRRAVLIGMAMNMGLGGLAGFRHLLDAARAGDWATAAAQIRASHYHTQLPERSERYARQLETGQWQT